MGNPFPTAPTAPKKQRAPTFPAQHSGMRHSWIPLSARALLLGPPHQILVPRKCQRLYLCFHSIFTFSFSVLRRQSSLTKMNSFPLARCLCWWKSLAHTSAVELAMSKEHEKVTSRGSEVRETVHVLQRPWSRSAQTF